MLSSVSSINKFHWCGNGDNSREKKTVRKEMFCARICVFVCVRIYSNRNGSIDKTIVMLCVCDNFLFVEWEIEITFRLFEFYICVYACVCVCAFVDWNAHANALRKSVYCFVESIPTIRMKKTMFKVLLWFIRYSFFSLLFVCWFSFIYFHREFYFYSFLSPSFTKFLAFCCAFPVLKW